MPLPDRDYAANGFVPPLTVDTGLASLWCVPLRRARGDQSQTQAGSWVTTDTHMR